MDYVQKVDQTWKVPEIYGKEKRSFISNTSLKLSEVEEDM